MKRSNFIRSRAFFLLQWMGPFVCRFSDAGMTAYRRTEAAGVRKAPRHEIAGWERRVVPRALWGFCRGVRGVGFEAKHRRGWSSTDWVRRRVVVGRCEHFPR